MCFVSCQIKLLVFTLLFTDDNSNQSSIADASPIKQENSSNSSPAPEQNLATQADGTEVKSDETQAEAKEQPGSEGELGGPFEIQTKKVTLQCVIYWLIHFENWKITIWKRWFLNSRHLCENGPQFLWPTGDLSYSWKGHTDIQGLFREKQTKYWFIVLKSQPWKKKSFKIIFEMAAAM